MNTPDTFIETTLSRRTFLTSATALAAGTALQTSKLLAADTPERIEDLQATSLSFSGKNHIAIPKLRYGGEYPISIEALVNPTKTDGEMTILGNQHSNGFALRMKGGLWEFVIHDGSRYVTAIADEFVEKDTPVHLAGICDGKYVGLFVNGEPQKTFGEWKGKHKASRFDLFVGADPDGTGRRPQHGFEGEISALRFSAQAKDFRKIEPFSNPNMLDVLYWEINEGEGDTVKDKSRFGYHGKIHGAEWVKRNA